MKKNMMILSIAGSLLLSLAGCSSMDSIDDGTVITDGDKTPTGNVATIYTTTSEYGRFRLRNNIQHVL